VPSVAFGEVCFGSLVDATISPLSAKSARSTHD
jgi:hypothetical protein